MIHKIKIIKSTKKEYNFQEFIFLFTRFLTKNSESKRDYDFPLFFTLYYECDIKYEYFDNFSTRKPLGNVFPL